MITAQQIAKDASLGAITGDVYEDSLKERIIAYAKQKCKEQRDICADIAEANEGVTFGIENASEPKFE